MYGTYYTFIVISVPAFHILLSAHCMSAHHLFRILVFKILLFCNWQLIDIRINLWELFTHDFAFSALRS